MAQPPRSDHSDRDKLARIERLRQRLATTTDLRGIIKGILDLLADEL